MATRDEIKRHVDPIIFRRGDGIARTHGVSSHKPTPDGGASGLVIGRDGAYRTTVALGPDQVTGDCECIARASMPVCKHMVALALVSLAEKPPDGPSPREILLSLGKERLVDMLLDLARSDGQVRTRIEALALASGGGSDLDIATIKRAITQATAVPRDPSWRSAATVHDDAMGAVALLRGLIDAKHHKCVALCEHTLMRVDRLISRVDDSDGYLGNVMEEITDLHLAACTATPPTPKTLAKRIIEIALGTDWDWMIDAPERYKDLLGDSGLSALDTEIARAQAKAEDAGGADADRSWSGPLSTLARMSESLARSSGDVDRVVATLARDLERPNRYVLIAAALAEAGRAREALTWLERGNAAHGPWHDDLRAQLVAAYLRDGLDTDAVALLRTAITERPAAGLFRELRRACPEQEWSANRAWALDQMDRASRPGERVAALLHDQDIPGAVQAARDRPLDATTRYALAQAAAPTDLDAALHHYRVLLADTLEQASKSSYRRTVAVLRDMHRAATPHNRQHEITQEVADLRVAYRRRPALCAMLDKFPFGKG